jgi:hypothetical protein
VSANFAATLPATPNAAERSEHSGARQLDDGAGMTGATDGAGSSDDVGVSAARDMTINAREVGTAPRDLSQ